MLKSTLIRNTACDTGLKLSEVLIKKMIDYAEAQSLLFPLLVKSAILLDVKTASVIKGYPGYSMLYQSVLDDLEKAINMPVREKDDWSILDKVDCDCRLCKTLSEFLVNAEQQSMVWPLAKERRQHIHGMISDMGIPVTHVTKREGSPHKLVLKKTLDLYVNVKNQRKSEEETYKKVRAFAAD